MFKDVLTSMDLSMAPVIALVCFFLAFVGIGLWLLLGKNAAHFDHMNALPLHDGVATFTAEDAGNPAESQRGTPSPNDTQTSGGRP